jgi:flagellar FliJ protein
MKRYRFGLASVLRVRHVEEDRAVLALAEAERARQVAERRAAALESQHRAVPPPDGAVEATQFLATREQQERSAVAVRGARAEVAEASTAVVARRAALAAAASARAALEHLDERRRAEHALELQREEAAEVDDLVTSRHQRVDVDS